MDETNQSILKILLVEDNPDDAELLMESLRGEVAEKIEIEWLPRLTAGLKRLKEKHFDAVLLDLNLPDSSGMDTLHKLRSYSTEIPIIVLTGLDDKEVALGCVKHGAQDYLVKGRPAQGAIYRVILYSVERCRADKAVKQLKLLEQRENFIAMLAHDLRSPITGSERIVSMILDGLAGSITSKQQQLLSLVSGTNKNLLLMINNVLDAYRLEAGGEKFQMIRLNLSTIIAECMQDIEPIAQSKNIQLRSNLNCPHDVLADPLAMRRVITNLINNAIKFTPVGGCVEVIFEKQDGKASLKIKDNGIGIQPEKMPFLFERFYQADAQNRTAGLGIGLHLCKHLVNAQKGDISCKSDPASGSIFEVILPIAYDKSVRALIVDDNAANRMVLQQMLKHLKVGSVSVCSGIEALSATSNHSFDAIFMDLQMPGLDGFDTSKAMRDAGIDSPIVAYTGFGDFGPSSFGESGISDVMHKPVELTRVREIVEQWMR